ncbi:MAG: tetratricopeptide repeat protein, partial [Planctomycetales bacterium]|nr:tetratricopeptide repeat protein [Planctomycetales bacterium]
MFAYCCPSLRRGSRIAFIVGLLAVSSSTVWAQSDQLEALYNRGVDLQRAGRYQEAIQHYEAALQMLVKQPGHRATERLCSNLADLYNSDGRDAEAAQLYEVVLQIQRKLYGDKSEATCRTLFSMSIAYIDLQQYDKADVANRARYEALAAMRGADSLEAAAALQWYGTTQSMLHGRDRGIEV